VTIHALEDETPRPRGRRGSEFGVARLADDVAGGGPRVRLATVRNVEGERSAFVARERGARGREARCGEASEGPRVDRRVRSAYVGGAEVSRHGVRRDVDER